MKLSWNFAKPDLGDGMNMCSQLSGCIGQHPIHAYQAKPLPLSYYSVVTAAPRWTLPHRGPMTRAWMDYITSSLTRAKIFVKCRKSAKLQHRHEQRRLRREHQIVGIRRTATGTRVKQGNLVLVKEADSALHSDCVHVKLTHDRWTGP